jgi:RTX calcium-binding nonapeptide repeat (4 copies)/Cadherin-like domain
MNMIDIQATRKTGNEAVGRERFELKNLDAKTHTPIYAGLMLTALALYLKSATANFSRANTAEPSPDEQPQPAPDSDQIGAGSSNSNLPAQAESHEDKSVAADKPKQSLLRNSTTDTYGLYEPLNIRDLEVLDLEFEAAGPRPMVSFGEAVKFAVLPGNTNSRTSEGDPPPEEDPTDDTEDDDDTPPNEDVDPDPSPRNRAPRLTSPVVLESQFACVSILIALETLLRGATDPDGDTLTITGGSASSGELVLTTSGFQYHGEEAGRVTITYQISDGEFVITQTAILDLLQRPPIEGTAGDDNLVGTACDDEIFGFGGHDTIDARGGNDVIFGGDGNDIIYGGPGDDWLSGEDGDDSLFGGAGDDIILGGSGNDILWGNDGADSIVGGFGADELHDGAGEDHVAGEEGNDSVFAEADGTDDIFDGGEDVDTLSYATSTADLTFDLPTGTVASEDGSIDLMARFEVFVAGSGNDVFNAVVGQPATEEPQGNDANCQADLVMLSSTSQDDSGDTVETLELYSSTSDSSESLMPLVTITTPDQSFDGGDGSDTLSYAEAQQSVTIDISSGTATGVEIGVDTFENIESFIGGHGDDHFILDSRMITLDGRGGHDTFEFLIPTTNGPEEQTHRQIRNFEVGDHVRISRYDIFAANEDDDENEFETAYGLDGEADDDGIHDEVVPIRIRHEIADLIQNTFIDADFNHDGSYEFSIHLDGEHQLVVVTQHIA